MLLSEVQGELSLHYGHASSKNFFDFLNLNQIIKHTIATTYRKYYKLSTYQKCPKTCLISNIIFH